MLQNLYFYRSSRKIQYDTPNGPTTLVPEGYCFLNTEVVKTYNLIGVLGILKLRSTFEDSEYFLFVTKGEVIGKIRGHNVYSIEKIKYLPIRGPTTSAKMDEVKDFIETHSFYCTLDEIKECYRWNALLQQNFKKHIVKTNNSYSNKIVKSPFMHSTSTCSQINDHSSKDQLYTIFVTDNDSQLHSLFCGYYEFQTYRSGDAIFNFEIRSFISTNKIGPRMLCRGIDKDGNVSFFVKTEFFCTPVKTSLYPNIRFTIFRGSVPLYWSQDDPLKPSKINFDQTEKENQQAFKRHFEIFTKDKETPIVIDLLSHHKHEGILSNMYKEYCFKEGIKYLSFNLNAYTNDYINLKKVLYDKLQKILQPENSCILDDDNDNSSEETNHDTKTIDSIDIENESNYHCSIPKVDKQIVFRINCLDCLDRTNLCQFLIFNYYNPYKFNIIKTMWKNNGNALSMVYTGSHALKSDFTKERKLSLFSRVNDIVISANRMINNKFNDKEKYKIIEILLKGESKYNDN